MAHTHTHIQNDGAPELTFALRTDFFHTGYIMPLAHCLNLRTHDHKTYHCIVHQDAQDWRRCCCRSRKHCDGRAAKIVSSRTRSSLLCSRNNVVGSPRSRSLQPSQRKRPAAQLQVHFNIRKTAGVASFSQMNISLTWESTRTDHNHFHYADTCRYAVKLAHAQENNSQQKFKTLATTTNSSK